MMMAIERIIWRDEELAPIVVAGEEDFSPRYDIVERGGRVVAQAAKLNLVNEVAVAGTRHDATNMNGLVQKSDAVGSFFYRPMASAVPLHNFPHVVQASSWTSLPPCPVDIGENPVCFEYDGKWHVTLGRMAEYNGLTYDIAIFDPATMEWDAMLHGGHKSVSAGGRIEDFGVYGNRLFVAGKDENDTTAATAWLDSLNLDDMSWTFGTTVTWAANVHSIGPIALAEQGTRPVVVGRDGIGTLGIAIDRFTATATAPGPLGLLPFVDGANPTVPVSVSRFGDSHICTFSTRHFLRNGNPTLAQWVNVNTHPPITSGHLLPVGADENFAVFVATQDGNSSFYRMDDDFGVTAHDMGCVLNQKSVVRGGSRYFHMRSANTDIWEPSADWAVFDVTTGTAVSMPPAPEVLENYGLVATENMIFAAKGNKAYIGYLDTVNQGVALGTVFKGLSVSATRDVFLVNDHRAITVASGVWHQADDDYLVCATPGVPLFGQIANI